MEVLRNFTSMLIFSSAAQGHPHEDSAVGASDTKTEDQELSVTSVVMMSALSSLAWFGAIALVFSFPA